MGAAAGAATLSKILPGCGDNLSGPGTIDTFVFLMMENRSYDHWFGARTLVEQKPGDGLTASMSNPDSNGMPVAPWEATRDLMCVPDPSPRDTNGTPFAAMRLSASLPRAASRTPAGSEGGPTITKSLCMTRRRSTTDPSATYFSSSSGA